MRTVFLLALTGLAMGCAPNSATPVTPSAPNGEDSLVLRTGNESYVLACKDDACDAIADLTPTRRNTACTMQYGGPERASVTGRIDGVRVDLKFGRGNGCEIARWDKLQDVLDMMASPVTLPGAMGGQR